MASALPNPSQCCAPTCTEPTSVAVPGPAGEDGADGANGTNGINAFTTFTADFTIPAELGSAVASVATSAWASINQIVHASKTDGSVSGYFQVTAIPSALSVTLKNLEDAATSAYLSNSAPGSIITSGSRLGPGGLQGPATSPTGAAGGDLGGTYPNPTIGIGLNKGDSLWGNGTNIVAVAASTNGHMLAYDSTDAEGVKAFKALPLTADTGVADMRVPRLDRPLGTEVPSPLQSSLVTITDTGAIRADGSGGNSRGTDAVDLQVNRTNATEVASGAESFLGGGDGNTVSGARAVCGGGDANTVSSTEGFVGGGEANSAITGDRAVVCGGQSNLASGTESFIGGGQSNEATASHTTVAGGDNNTASAADATVGGGASNQATGANSTVSGGTINVATAQDTTVAGGSQNSASGTASTVAGGTLNTASGAYSSIAGGIHGVADKSGSIAHSGGRFASNGDAQTMQLVMRNNTTGATPTELFLDGAALRATIPINTSWVFSLLTVARDDQAGTAETSAWKVEGVITNDNGTTTLAAAVTSTTLVNDSGVWAHAVTASDASDALIITFTGEAARNIRIVSHVRLVQVTY